MQTKALGSTDLQLTRVGLGTWAMGGEGWKFGWGPQDDAESIRAIHRALELGVNWIDTAPAYGLGHCEEVVGRAIKGLAQRPIIATKCGRCWNERREMFPRLKKESVRAELDASLRRLGVDVIDLYQVHWPEPDEDIEEAWGVVAEAVRAGKIRHAGVSNFSVAQLERIRPIHPIASLQPPYSMLRARRRKGTAAVLRGSRHRRGRLQPHAKGTADRQDHPRLGRATSAGRSSPQRPAIPRAAPDRPIWRWPKG